MSLPTSVRPLQTFVASAPNVTVTGTGNADRLTSVGSIVLGGDTLVGGAGDDTYVVNSIRDIVVEQAGEGIDTVTTFGSYRLSNNVENLTLRGSNGIAGRGNALDNIIIGNAGDNLIDGGRGDDELTGGDGNDIFRIQDADTIFDFRGGTGLTDAIDLSNYARFTSFAQVQAALTQVGSDTKLFLENDTYLTLVGVSKSSITADDFIFAQSGQGLKLAFGDEFDKLSLYTNADATGIWEPQHPYTGLPAHTTVNHQEAQYYTDPTDTGTTMAPLGLNPFSVSNGVLTIQATRVDEATSAKIYGYDYISGMLSSYPTFAQTYGYFEMRAKLPEGAGLHPAFWLLPINASWPPELDVMEQRGADPYQTTGTVHSNLGGQHTAVSSSFEVGNSATAFHTYGVNWAPDFITWYVDGEVVSRAETPADLNTPMYMIANLAVGGPWAGQPNGTTPFPAQMQIDYIRAYANASTLETGPADKTATAADGDLYGTSWNDTLSAGAGNHTLYAGPGDDVLHDGSGTATLLGHTGNDTYHIDNAATTVVEKANEGMDTVITTLSKFSLPTYFEDLTYAGRDTFTGIGNNVANVIHGGDGGNNLSGQGGDDTIYGGDGNDTIYGGDGSDTLIAGAGSDLVRGGAGADTIDGGNGNDTIYGEDGDDVINGSYGNDVIRGGAGVNKLIGGSGAGADTFGGDTVQGIDAINGGSGVDLYLATGADGATITVNLGDGTVTGGYRSGSTLANVERVQLWSPDAKAQFTGNWADNELIGGNSADTLSGAGGNDILKGGAGSDVLDGGSGSDRLFGGTGSDTFVFTRGQAQGDYIGDFSTKDGDLLKFVDYGSNATFHVSATDPTVWVIESANGYSESIQFSASPWDISKYVLFA